MSAPVVYVSGWGSDANAWDGVRARAPGPVVPWWDALDAAPAALDRAIADADAPPVLVGWSLGGQLVLSAALRRPEGVHGLVLVGTPARFTGDGGHPGADPRTLNRMRRGVDRDPDRVLASFWTNAAWPAPAATADTWRARATADVPRERLAAGLDHLAATDLRPALPAIAAPAIVLHGEHDTIVPVEAGAHLAAALANAHLRRMDGGHALPFSHPDAIAAAVTEIAHDGHA